MKTLDEILKSAGAATQGDSSARLTNGILKMLSGPEVGGLGGLVNLFQSKGLGAVVSSWIGKGPNQSITSDQVREVFGSEMLQQFAGHLSTNAQEVPSLVAKLLPTIVDELTPNGTLPQGDLLADAGKSFPTTLQGMLGGKDHQ